MSDFIFDGFEPANTTPVPDVLFDKLLPHLNEAQLKVMLYIIRRTLGFKKTSDAISLKQFRHGITTKDGKKLDEGCGLKNYTSIIKALNAMEQMGCIESEKAETDEGDQATTVYRIHFRGTARNGVPPARNGVPTTPSAVPTASNGGRVLRETESQETVLQQTDNLSNDRATDVASPTDLLSSLPDQALVDEIHRREKEKLTNASLIANPTTEKTVEPKATRNTSSKPRSPRVKVTQERKTEPLLSEEARAVWNEWLSLPWHGGIEPKLTQTAADHCKTLSLADEPITRDIMFKVRNFAKKNDTKGFYKDKKWALGDMVNEYPNWKSAQYQLVPETKQENKPYKSKAVEDYDRMVADVQARMAVQRAQKQAEGMR